METKAWWQSRTIWLQIIAAFFALLAMFGVVPKDITADWVVEAIMAVVALVTIILRLFSSHKIAGAATDVQTFRGNSRNN